METQEQDKHEGKWWMKGNGEEALLMGVEDLPLVKREKEKTSK